MSGQYHYRVEWSDDNDTVQTVPYQHRRTAAMSKARRVSKSSVMVAYVVACRVTRYGEEPCGHKSYGNGSVMETDGEGF